MKKIKKALSVIIAAVMVFAMVPAVAMADETEPAAGGDTAQTYTITFDVKTNEEFIKKVIAEHSERYLYEQHPELLPDEFQGMYSGGEIVSGQTQIPAGETVMLSFGKDNNATDIQWKVVDGSGSEITDLIDSNEAVVSFSMPASDITVSAGHLYYNVTAENCEYEIEKAKNPHEDFIAGKAQIGDRIVFKYPGELTEQTIKWTLVEGKGNLLPWREEPYATYEMSDCDVKVKAKVVSNMATIKIDWDDNDNIYGARPDEVKIVTVDPSGIGSTELSLNGSNDWTITLRVYPSDYVMTLKDESSLNQRGYTVTDVEMNDYDVTYHIHYGGGYINPGDDDEKTASSVVIEWNYLPEAPPSELPEDVKVALIKNKVEIVCYEYMNAANEWKATVNDLYKYDAGGSLFEYEWAVVDELDDYQMFSEIENVYNGTLTRITLSYLPPDDETETPYNLWVNGKAVTEENKDNIPVTSGTASYDPVEKTLTLNNAEIRRGKRVEGIYSLDDLNIVLVGENTIDMTDYMQKSTGLGASGTLNISGTGSLEIKSSNYGIISGGSMILDGGTINISKPSYGIFSHDDLTVNDGNIYVDSSGFGVFCHLGNFEMKGGILTAKGEKNALDPKGLKYRDPFGSEGYEDIFKLGDGVRIMVPEGGGFHESSGYIRDGNGSDRVKEVTLETFFRVNIRNQTPGYGNIEIKDGNGEYKYSDVISGDGVTVELTVTPEDGYELGYMNVADAAQTLPVTKGENNTYTFKMPKANVTVSAGFTKRTIRSYDLWVNGVQVTENNASEIPVDSGTAVYDPDEGTLTLTDAEITKGYMYQEGYVYTAGIYANTDLKIVLMGENKITLTGSYTEGITVEEGKTLTITGEGSLETEGCAYGIFNDNASLKIESGTINAKGTSNGISCSRGSITVTGGSLTAQSTGGDWAIDLTEGSISYPDGYLADPAGGRLNGAYFVDEDGDVAAKVVIEEPIEKYDLWVNGVQVTSKNTENIPVDSGTAVYDPDENTLTLTNAEITKGYMYKEGWVYTAGIYTNTDLTMVLEGENKITLTERNSYGITVEEGKTLTIEGEGSLETEGIASGISNYNANLKIESGTIKAQGGSNGIDNTQGSMTVSGGSLTAQGDGHGISSTEGSITVTGGSLTAQSTGSGKAIDLTEGSISYPDGYLAEPAGGGLNEYGYCFVDKDGNEVSKVVIEKTVKKYELWVNGEQVTENNASEIPVDSGTAVYDPDENTLTLTNAEITKGYMYKEGWVYTAGIYTNTDLTMVLEGENKITLTESSSCGITVGEGKTLTITGEGSLETEGWANGIYNYSANLKIESGTINAKGIGFGISSSEGSITVTGGSLTAQSTDGNWAINLMYGTISYPDGYLADPAGGRLNGAYFVDKDGNEVSKVVIEKPVKKYELWVNGEQVTENNASEIPVDSGTAVYDPDENTLTLTDAKITKGYNFRPGWVYIAGIYVNMDLTMKLENTNEIDLEYADYSLGIVNEEGNTLNFAGTGTLKIRQVGNGIYNDDAFTNIEDADIDIESAGSGISNSSGSITVESGTVKVKSSDFEGISSGKGSITLKGGSLSAESTSMHGIYQSFGGIDIQGGTFYAKSGNGEEAIRDLISGNISFNENTHGITTPEGAVRYEESRSGEVFSWIADKDDKYKMPNEVRIEPVYKVTVTKPENGTVTADREMIGEAEIRSENGAAVTLTVAPAEGYILSSISAGDGVTVETIKENETYTFKMPESNVVVTAEFEEITLQSMEITTEPDNTEYKCGDTFDSTGMVIEGTYSDGTKAEITDYTISPDGGLTSEDTEITVTAGGLEVKQEITVSHDMEEHKEVPAVCEAEGTEAYWTCKGCGKMFSDENGENEITEPVVIEALGHDWGDWVVTKEPSAEADGEQTRTCKHDETHKETTAIAANGHTVTVTGGTSDKGKASPGDTVTIKAETKSGYKFKEWTVKAGNVTLANSKSAETTFEMPDEDTEIEAVFIKNSSGGGGASSMTNPIEIKKPENGSITADPEKAQNGQKVTLKAEPADGYETDKVTVTDKDGKEIPVKENADGTYSFTMGEGKVFVSADFKEKITAPLLEIEIGSRKYQLNGAPMEMDTAPFIDENDRTMLPVRVVANALGISDGDIAWDNTSKTAFFTRPDGKVVSCTAGVKMIKIGGEEVEIDTAPVIRDDRIFLPMRALFNAFNVSDDHILWDEIARTVTVTREALKDMEALKAEDE